MKRIERFLHMYVRSEFCCWSLFSHYEWFVMPNKSHVTNTAARCYTCEMITNIVWSWTAFELVVVQNVVVPYDKAANLIFLSFLFFFSFCGRHSGLINANVQYMRTVVQISDYYCVLLHRSNHTSGAMREASKNVWVRRYALWYNEKCKTIKILHKILVLFQNKFCVC